MSWRLFIRRSVVILALLASVFPTASAAQVPTPTHGNLVRFGYYFVDEKYGDDSAAVWPYTNFYIAIPEAYDSSNSDWQTPFRASLAKATIHHKAIYLVMREVVNGSQTITWDSILDVAQDFWGQIVYVEIAHEEDLSIADTNARVSLLNSKLSQRGLGTRSTGAIFTTAQIFSTNAIFAEGLDFVTIEAYLGGPGDPSSGVNVANLNNYLAAAKERVASAEKSIILVMQGYDRNGSWTNITNLEALQMPVYLAAYNDPNVVAISVFSYNRPGGSKAYPTLTVPHRQIGSAMGISPRMWIDIPWWAQTVGQPFTIAGWSIDLASSSGTGVGAVHVWAYPSSGAPVFLGSASVGGHRPDVGVAFGSSEFDYSGWSLTSSGLAPGTYTIVAYSWSTVIANFNKAMVVVVNVQ